MCSATLGAGALSLPYAVEQVGVLGGCVMLLTTSAASHYSTCLLVSAIAQTSSRSYEELTVSLFGKTVGVITEVNIVLFCYGTVIAYTMALGDLLHPFASPLGLDQRTTTVLVWLLLMLPLSLVEKISHLQWPSLFGVAAVVYLVLSVVAHAGVCAFGEVTMAAAAAGGDAGASGGRSPMNSSTFDLAAGGAGLRRFAGGEDGRMRLWAWGPSSLEAIAIALFAFTCQVNVPALLAELEDEEGGAGGAGGAADEDGDSDDDAPAASASASAAAGKASSETPAARRSGASARPTSPRRSRASPMKQVSLRAMCICLSCYILVGLAGYRDAPSSPNGNLLKNYCIVASPHSLIPTHTSSRLMAPASLAMAVSVLMAYPFNIHPCRYTLDVMCFRHFGAVRSAVRHVVWTLLISGTSLLASLYIPGINIVFQLMGSTCSAFVCFILPAAFGLRLGLPEAGGPYRTPVGTAACVALLVGGAAIGVLATASTIAGLMAGEDAAKEAARAALPDVCDRHACRA